MFVDDADVEKAGFLDQWKRLDAKSSGAPTTAMRLLNDGMIIQKAPEFLPLDAPVSTRKKLAEATTPAQENDERFKMASTALRSSASWSPEFGLIGGLKFAS